MNNGIKVVQLLKFEIWITVAVRFIGCVFCYIVVRLVCSLCSLGDQGIGNLKYLFDLYALPKVAKPQSLCSCDHGGMEDRHLISHIVVDAFLSRLNLVPSSGLNL